MEEIFKKIIIGILILLFFASITYIVKFIRKQFHKRKIYNYLESNTSDKIGEKFKSTIEISNSCDLSVNRVTFICEIHKKIGKSIKSEGKWSIFGSNEGSVYDERGIIFI
jgi:hypothetical protein